MPIIPKPKGMRPMMGTIQWTALSTDQPYQKKVIGIHSAKNMQAGRRISGSKTPSLARVMRITVASEILATTIMPLMKPMPRPIYARPERWLAMCGIRGTFVAGKQRRKVAEMTEAYHRYQEPSDKRR